MESVRARILFVQVAVAVLCNVVATSYSQKFPFQDPTLPWDVRVDDLVNRLSLEEITPQTMAIYPKPTPAIPRLGIKPYVWQTECLRGIRRTNSTAFPQAIGLAAAFSPALIYNVSEATSYEVRAFWNENVKRGIYRVFSGLSCFSPVINIMRDPRWGRSQETYGEDPYLSGVYAQHFVHGLQGDHPRYVRANAGCKHFDVHGGPENIPSSRFSFDSKVSERDWRMTFLPQFKMCVDAGSLSLMCSYNSINGIPACANSKLLTSILREEWGFSGYIVSDESAIINILKQHNFTKSPEETVAKAIHAGCNLELCNSRKGYCYQNQINASAHGLITEATLRANVKPLFYIRMRLGEFDPPTDNPYNTVDASVIQNRQHRNLAQRAAQMSFVLLKNEGEALPLPHSMGNIALVGPMADNVEEMFGDYAPDIVASLTSTPYQGLKTVWPNLVYRAGCDSNSCQNYNSSAIKEATMGAKVVIVCLGLGQELEMEGHDRADLDLPGHQLALLKDAVYYSDGAAVILLVFNAGPLDITWAKLSPAVHAIMACYYPAQSTGKALAAVLSGAGEFGVPAGRLPNTWPAYLAQVPPMENYTMEGRTYRYYREDPLYPFGYGLSYTSFKYISLDVMPASIRAGQNVSVAVKVQNTGQYDADEVIQVYMSWTQASVPVPKLQLVGFNRVPVKKGQVAAQTFVITSEQMQVWISHDVGFKVESGLMLLYAGGQQPNQRTQVDSNVLSGQFKVL